MWAWFLLATRYALRVSIGSAITFSMPEVRQEGQRSLTTSLYRLCSSRRQACHQAILVTTAGRNHSVSHSVIAVTCLVRCISSLDNKLDTETPSRRTGLFPLSSRPNSMRRTGRIPCASWNPCERLTLRVLSWKSLHLTLSVRVLPLRSSSTRRCSTCLARYSRTSTMRSWSTRSRSKVTSFPTDLRSHVGSTGRSSSPHTK